MAQNLILSLFLWRPMVHFFKEIMVCLGQKNNPKIICGWEWGQSSTPDSHSRTWVKSTEVHWRKLDTPGVFVIDTFTSQADLRVARFPVFLIFVQLSVFITHLQLLNPYYLSIHYSFKVNFSPIILFSPPSWGKTFFSLLQLCIWVSCFFVFF